MAKIFKYSNKKKIKSLFLELIENYYIEDSKYKLNLTLRCANYLYY